MTQIKRDEWKTAGQCYGPW